MGRSAGLRALQGPFITEGMPVRRWICMLASSASRERTHRILLRNRYECRRNVGIERIRLTDGEESEQPRVGETKRVHQASFMAGRRAEGSQSRIYTPKRHREASETKHKRNVHCDTCPFASRTALSFRGAESEWDVAQRSATACSAPQSVFDRGGRSWKNPVVAVPLSRIGWDLNPSEWQMRNTFLIWYSQGDAIAQSSASNIVCLDTAVFSITIQNPRMVLPQWLSIASSVGVLNCSPV